MEEIVSFCGRVLTASELNLVRQIIADFPRLSQAELAYTICELMEWRRPNGKLKNPECVEWLQKWQQRVLPGLPHLQLIEDLPGRRLFQQYIQRYHPLGYRVPYGAQLRYLVRTPSQDALACLLFTSAAWKMAPRDR